jgi:hypothetical protein
MPTKLHFEMALLAPLLSLSGAASAYDQIGKRDRDYTLRGRDLDGPRVAK